MGLLGSTPALLLASDSWEHVQLGKQGIRPWCVRCSKYSPAPLLPFQWQLGMEDVQWVAVVAHMQPLASWPVDTTH